MTQPLEAGSGQAEPPLQTRLEAILLVVDEPATTTTLAQILEQPVDDVDAALASLQGRLDAEQRGFELRNVAGGWRFYSRAECAPWVKRFLQDGQPTRLSQAALETLAVVAFQQPVTRSRIAGIRGVNVDAVVRNLTNRGLIAETGVEPGSGAVLYVTTIEFLERMGLDSIADLPAIADSVPGADEIFDDVAISVRG